MNDNPLASGWFYSKAQAPGGHPIGPLSWEQLTLLGQAGTLGATDWVWHPTLTNWIPAGQVLGMTAPPAEVAGRTDTPAGRPAGRGPRFHYLWIVPLAAVLVIALGLGLFFGLRNGDGGRDLDATATTEPGVTPTTGVTEPPSTTLTTARPGSWLVMMYEDADDEVLEEDIAFDLNEAELVGSTDQMKIVSQMDRYVGGYEGDGDVTATKRYLVTQDADIYTVNSRSSPTWAKRTWVTADPLRLRNLGDWVISVRALCSHPVKSRGRLDRGLDRRRSGARRGLSMQEIDNALGAIVADTGIGIFELVGFDACLMGQLEVMSAVAPHARYAVGSEESEPALGWGYAGFLRALQRRPVHDRRELGQAIVDSYVVHDIRITDDEARACWLEVTSAQRWPPR